MKIQITFDSWEELTAFRTGEATTVAAPVEAPVRNIFEEAKAKVAEIAAAPEEPVVVETVEAETVEAEPAAVEEAPFEEEPAKDPEYGITDVQKAVRELIKSKGKDAAKAVLEKFGAKNASSVKVEDYSAIVPALVEALNA